MHRHETKLYRSSLSTLFSFLPWLSKWLDQVFGAVSWRFILQVQIKVSSADCQSKKWTPLVLVLVLVFFFFFLGGLFSFLNCLFKQPHAHDAKCLTLAYPPNQLFASELWSSSSSGFSSSEYFMFLDGRKYSLAR